MKFLSLQCVWENKLAKHFANLFSCYVCNMCAFKYIVATHNRIQTYIHLLYLFFSVYEQRKRVGIGSFKQNVMHEEFIICKMDLTDFVSLVINWNSKQKVTWKELLELIFVQFSMTLFRNNFLKSFERTLHGEKYWKKLKQFIWKVEMMGFIHPGPGTLFRSLPV